MTDRRCGTCCGYVPLHDSSKRGNCTYLLGRLPDSVTQGGDDPRVTMHENAGTRCPAWHLQSKGKGS